MLTPDLLWKGIIEDFFPQLIAFFFPGIAKEIDYDRVEFLEQELNQLFPEREGKIRRVDKLVKVWLHNGEEKWLLIHLEVQSYRDKEFELRMFTYAYRIFDRYGRLVEALAILTDPYKTYHPKAFTLKSEESKTIGNYGIRYQFRTYKLLDQSREELAASDNPIALALLVAYDSILKKKQRKSGKVPDSEQFELKTAWLRLLLEKGYDREAIEKLTTFIKHYLPFSKSEMIVTFDKHVADQTQNKEGMGIIERVENELKRMAFEEGFGEGIAKGKQEGKLEGKQEGKLEGTKAGILLGRIQSLESLLSQSLLTTTRSEDLAIAFELPIEWVERIRKGDIPGREEAEKFLANQTGSGYLDS